jgi:pyridoxine 4-dehydrogenase
MTIRTSEESASSLLPHRETRAQIALAWLLAQKPWIAPIPGTTRLHRQSENVGPPQSICRPPTSPPSKPRCKEIKSVGDRYPAHIQQRVDC